METGTGLQGIVHARKMRDYDKNVEYFQTCTANNNKKKIKNLK